MTTTNRQTTLGDWLGLTGKVGVVTGAASGIGAEIARALAGVGVAVALLDREEKGAIEVAESIVATGSKAVGIGCDVSDAQAVAAAADRVAREFGPCQVLVNNAGMVYPDALLKVDIPRWNKLMAVNITGPLLCVQAFGQQMIGRRGGVMVHVASMSGKFPQPYSGAYSVSKAGLLMLSRLLAVELGEHGIRSNTVSPGMIRTPLSEPVYQNPEVVRRREEIVPARRISGPNDIAEAVLFLVSDRSSYINGQDILLDGGLTQASMGLIPRPGFEKKDAQ